jgi:hypothetical protein
VEVKANINGTDYHWLVERLSRERLFAQDGLRVTGRGLAAVLDKPYAPIGTFGNAEARSAAQLIEDVLTLNGVSLGWDVDFGLEDWNVPGGLWTKQGSYVEAITEIAAAAGGYVQPTASTKGLRVLPRYPTLPWEWGSVTPHFELPADVVTREGIEWAEKPRYDRVYVSGVGGGVLCDVKRSGAAGEVLAPMVTDSLITAAAAGRQRGGAILADTGRVATVSLRLPVLAETGVIPPGKFVRYLDGGAERLGLTRSVNVDVNGIEVWQTLGVETHE